MSKKSSSVRIGDQSPEKSASEIYEVDAYEIKLLRPDEVVVDREHVVQRPEIESHVKSIASGYEPALFGIGYVSLRGDGKYYLLDGQHRVAAAKRAKKQHIRVPFYVRTGLSIADEAKLFLELNANKKKVDAISTFRAGVTAGNPENLEIVAILENFGLRCSVNPNDGCVSAISAVIDIYRGKVGGGQLPKPVAGVAMLPQSHLLSRTLFILSRAWGKERAAYDRTIMKGIAAFLLKHQTRVSGERLADLLTKNETPVRASGKIRALKDAARIAPTAAAVQFFEGVYNRHLSEDKRLK